MTHDDDEILLILTEVERYIGSFANGQREKTITAIRENADGVLQLAKRLAANQTVRSTVAVFITSIERGEHRLAPTPEPAPPTAIPPRRATPHQPITLEQLAYNQRLAPIMRRVAGLRATTGVAAAQAGLTGHAALDAAEAYLDELERIPGEPDAVEVNP